MADAPGLHDLVFQGQVEAIKRILDEHPHLADHRDDEGNTLLHSACCAKNLEIVELLLAYPVDIHARGCYQYTPLHYAVYYGDSRSLPIVRTLLGRGADPDVVDTVRHTPTDLVKLHLDEDPAEVMELLRRASKKPAPWPDMSGWPTIHQLAFKGDSPAFYRLLTQDRELVHLRNPDGNTPLHLVCWANQLGVLGGLLAFETDVNSRGQGGRTPLHYAVHEGDRFSDVIVASLLSNGADPTITDDQGNTPADWARLRMKDGLPEVLAELAKGRYPQYSEESIQTMLPNIIAALRQSTPPEHLEEAIQLFVQGMEHGRKLRAGEVSDDPA